LEIIILSTYDADGSGQFARQLLRILHEIGYKARILCVKSSYPDSDVTGVYDSSRLSNILYKVKTRLARVLFKTNPDYAFHETYHLSDRALLSSLQSGLNCKLIICTFLSGMISPQSLLRLREELGRPPVIFYGVDMNFYTGGCHYARGCEQYYDECTQCPAVTSLAHEFVKKQFSNKKRLISEIPNHLVIASSHQHYREMKASKIFSASRIEQVLMPVDHKLYGAYEAERNALKSRYGFGGITLLVRSSSEPRKGSDVFISAIRELYENRPNLAKNLQLIAIGDNYISEKLSDLNIRLFSPGYIYDLSELSKLYSASDIFINTSLADSGPMMLSQSLMSSTPVITTDVGLARDLIRNNHNGVILADKSVNELTNAITDFITKSDSDIAQMRINARETSLQLLSWQIYKDKIELLLNDILAE